MKCSTMCSLRKRSMIYWLYFGEYNYGDNKINVNYVNKGSVLLHP